MESYFDKKEEYLYVKIKGQYVKEERTKVLKLIYDECNQNDYSKMLFDITDVQLDDDIFERYLNGKEIALIFRKDMTKCIKIALIAQPTKIQDTHLKFEELVARNMGLDYMVFPNERKALKWLLK